VYSRLGGLHDCLRGDVATGAGAVLDDELLTQALRKKLAHQTRDRVAAGPRSEATDDMDRSRRIPFCPGDTGCWERGDSRCQMKKLSARNVHDVLSMKASVQIELLPSHSGGPDDRPPLVNIALLKSTEGFRCLLLARRKLLALLGEPDTHRRIG
jgi:hypothetical protein